MSSLFRLAHISDLHFAKPTWNLNQFFSKRWLGNANQLFTRKHQYAPDNLYTLVEQFTALGVSHVLITGDVSTTSLEAEFALAKEFVDQLKQAQMQVFILPGNHDQYTRQAYRDKVFYQFFDSRFSLKTPFDMKQDCLAVSPLTDQWWLITLDTALATSLISSCGRFTPELEEKLDKALQGIPSQDNVIIANHFPFFHNDSPRKILKRGSALKKLILRYPNIRLYLHGHTHRHCIADLRAAGLPIILDSGSTAHQQIGSWNLVDMQEDSCTVSPFYWQQKWVEKTPQTFRWQDV